MTEDEITGKVIGAAIKVHQAPGSGLFESAYEQCLAYELNKSGLEIKKVHNVNLK